MKPDISIIIVAYQVRGFISFCLKSIKRNKGNFHIETIVLDNGSDRFLENLLSQKFPNVSYIDNEKNIGFAKACNRGAAIAEGKYLLFLNPDTIISRNTLGDLLVTVSQIEKPGLLTVNLIDGKGDMLLETARQIPTFSTAFYKIFGIDRGYYSHINDADIQPIQAVCGAFALCRHDIFNKVGGFDEQYFMYGEDIDLSKRFLDKGYQNYLINRLSIVHFKGESTKKNKWNYNYNFYRSMYLFFQKYESPGIGRVKIFLVHVATIFLSVFSLIWKILKSSVLPIRDMLIAVTGVFIWAKLYAKLQFGAWDYYDIYNVITNGFLYGLCWVGISFAAGNYLTRSRPSFVAKSILLGIVISLIFYALLPLELRFSRAVLLLSGSNFLLFKMLSATYFWNRKKLVKIVVFADAISKEEEQFIYRCITPSLDLDIRSNNATLQDKIGDHVIWDVDNPEDVVALLRNQKVRISLWDRSEGLLMSSVNPRTQGTRLNRLSHHNLAHSTYRHQKRCIDLLIGLLAFIPLIIIQLVQFRNSGFNSWAKLMTGKMTSLGYDNMKFSELPNISTSVMNVYSDGDNEVIKGQKALHYAMHYTTLDDAIGVLNRFGEFIKSF